MPVVLRGADPTRFDGLFDFADLETYLFTARPPAGEVRLVKNGQWPPVAMVLDLLLNRSYDVQAIYNGLAEGYTVVLNGIHHRWPPAARLVRDLDRRGLACITTTTTCSCCRRPAASAGWCTTSRRPETGSSCFMTSSSRARPSMPYRDGSAASL